MTNLEQISIFVVRKPADTAHDQEIYRQPYKFERENTALSSKNLSATILFQVGLPLFIEKPIRNRTNLREATAVLPKSLSATVLIRENLPLFYQKTYP